MHGVSYRESLSGSNDGYRNCMRVVVQVRKENQQNRIREGEPSRERSRARYICKGRDFPESRAHAVFLLAEKFRKQAFRNIA